MPLGDAVKAIEEEAKALPATITTSFQGTAQVYQPSTKGLALLLILAIFVIYIILGVLYESYIHPLTILSGLPSAGFGALMTLLLFGKDLNLYAFVGIIMLVGIVKKNAIMMIDFALETQRKEGKAPLEAIYQGCLVRFRPIMMTTMAALMGTLPIALGFRRRRRGAPATGPGGGRRAARLAAPDPLHHPGDLLLYGLSAAEGTCLVTLEGRGEDGDLTTCHEPTVTSGGVCLFCMPAAGLHLCALAGAAGDSGGYRNLVDLRFSLGPTANTWLSASTRHRPAFSRNRLADRNPACRRLPAR